VQLLLALTAANLRSSREQRRRIGAFVLAFAALCAAVALLFAGLWVATDRRADAISDRPLVRIDALNVEIPDPRPSLERGTLRLRALVYGVAALASAGVGLVAAVLWVLIRPSRLPPDLVAAMDELSGRGPPPA
jgi:hypothetical protein